MIGLLSEEEHDELIIVHMPNKTHAESKNSFGNERVALLFI
jgi:hypothetical protein